MSQETGADGGIRRKERKKYSCAECRRLKLKCNREVPCNNCIKRSCGKICPDGVRPRVRGESARTREEQLEQILIAHGLQVPDKTAMRDGGTNGKPAPETSIPSPSSNGTASPSRRSFGRRRSASPGLFNLDRPRPHDRPSARPFSASNPSSLPADPSAESQSVFSDVAFPPRGPTLEMGTTSTSSSTLLLQPEQSSGTLVLSHSGRSKYLGPRAANEWLRDQEEEEPMDTPFVSRAPSPAGAKRSAATATSQVKNQFPFGKDSHTPSFEDLLNKLPSEALARSLVEAYFRYYAWTYDIIPEHQFRPIIEDILLRRALPEQLRERPGPLYVQQVALVYVVLAMGALHNLEMPPEDPVVEEYVALAKACLIKGNFLIHSTIAAVQTLHIMANVLLETERGRNGDSAWPLWGMSMRMIQAMGVHRDGARWNLGENEIEERRRAFWETYTGDTLQANCFSRPSSMDSRYADAEYPIDPHAIRTQGTEKGYHSLKFDLSKLSAKVLHQTLSLNSPSYDEVMALHGRLCAFEKGIPRRFRCRAALLALPSQYQDAETVLRESPEVDKWDLHLTLQQFHLSLMISEAVVNLHRPYFVRALQSRRDDPLRSIYGTSFLVVVERCNVLIQIACSLYALHPSVSARYWFFWYHAFNSAVTLGTFMMTDPNNELVPFASALMDQVINVYTMLVQSRASQRMTDNLRWLLRLRKRSSETLVREVSPRGEAGEGVSTTEEDDRELLGWRTRLIQRIGKGVQKATTIVGPVTSTPSPYSALTQTMTEALQQQLATNGPAQAAAQRSDSSSEQLHQATDELLRSFWMPTTAATLPADISNTMPFNFNWWDIDIVDPNESMGVQGSTMQSEGAPY